MLRTSFEKTIATSLRATGCCWLHFESIEIAHGKLVILHKVCYLRAICVCAIYMLAKLKHTLRYFDEIS